MNRVNDSTDELNYPTNITNQSKNQKPFIEITDQNIKAFDPIARKSGLDYNVKKIENGKPPTYLVSFKGKDIDVMTEAFREFTAKKLGRDKKPSIRKLLSTLKDKAAALNAQKDKVKKKDREVSL